MIDAGNVQETQGTQIAIIGFKLAQLCRRRVSLFGKRTEVGVGAISSWINE